MTRYIKPKREDYKSRSAYLEAIRINGKGKETRFGTKPEANVTIAAYVNLSKKVSKRGTFQRGTIIRIRGDGINITGKVDDRCAAAEELWKKEKAVQFDVFSKMSQKQADNWGKRKMTVEILGEVSDTTVAMR